jgi:CheY-like chemotaxis protein
MSKAQIVIVEDNPGDVDVLRMALDGLGEDYELAVLSDGAEALRFVQQKHAGVKEPDPCVILLDLHLPKYDGIEVLEALRREPSLKHVHVMILTSGPPLPREEAAMRRLGAIFRQKPSSLDEVGVLAAEVMELCKGVMV